MNNAMRRKKYKRRRRHTFLLFVLTVTAVSVIVVAACIFSESAVGRRLFAASGVNFENMDGYPADLLELAEKNKEAVYFVLAYPENKDKAPAQTAEEVEKGIAVQFLQWDKRWGYARYGDSFLAVSGCGPTALAMAAAGLTGDQTITPYAVACYAEENGYYVDGVGSSWSLISEGCAHFGLRAEELSLSYERIRDCVEAGMPVICSMRPGDFTTTGHFIVIYGTENNQLKIYDPNSIIRSDQLWDYERISGQINNLWAMSLA